MYVSDLTAKDFDKIRAFNGTKTIKELFKILEIENKSHSNLRYVLDKKDIPYKLPKGRQRNRKSNERKPKESYKSYKRPVQVSGVILQVGSKYNLRNKEITHEDRKEVYQGRVIREYRNYYLGISDNGVRFTIFKHPNCWEIKETS